MRVCDACGSGGRVSQHPWGAYIPGNRDPREPSGPTGHFDLCQPCTTTLREQGIRGLIKANAHHTVNPQALR